MNGLLSYRHKNETNILLFDAFSTPSTLLGTLQGLVLSLLPFIIPLPAKHRIVCDPFSGGLFCDHPPLAHKMLTSFGIFIERASKPFSGSKRGSNPLWYSSSPFCKWFCGAKPDTSRSLPRQLTRWFSQELRCASDSRPPSLCPLVDYCSSYFYSYWGYGPFNTWLRRHPHPPNFLMSLGRLGCAIFRTQFFFWSFGGCCVTKFLARFRAVKGTFMKRRILKFMAVLWGSWETPPGTP